MQLQMLAPAAVLVLWSMIMLFWLAGARNSAMKSVDTSEFKGKPGVRGQDVEGIIPDKANWKSHNYTHLMEQPTVFYPAVIILALAGANAVDVTLAWTYVALRVVHSIWQATVNKVSTRFLIFLLSSLVMTALAIRAVIATLFTVPGLMS